MEYGYLFIKFGSAKYIDDMFDKEYLYFNKYSIFKQRMPNEPGRFDPREGNLKNIQISDLDLKINSGDKEIKFGKSSTCNAQYCEHINDPNLISCSLYSVLLSAGINSVQVDDRMSEFGDKALVIFDSLKFWDMIDESLELDDKWYKRDFVELYNPEVYNGDLSFFHKNEEYSYLNEYRILKQVHSAVPTSVKLPGLQKISMIADFNQLREFTVTVT